MLHANPMNGNCRRYRRNLGAVIRPNLSLAATHLRHLSALPMHRSAAGTLLMAHRHTRQTGHNGRGCGEQ
jgi:hypothetical protein